MLSLKRCREILGRDNALSDENRVNFRNELDSSGSGSGDQDGNPELIAVLRSGEPPLVVFVSSRISTQTRWARDAVADTLQQSNQFKPWLFEHAPASSEILADSYLAKVRESDLVIWLVEQETTEPVRAEITAALEATRRILMFRITPLPSDSATESLITCVGTKWDYVADAADLKGKLQAALGDEIVRAWRAAGRPTKPPILDTLSAQSRSRCIDRWLAAGISDRIAECFADDPSIGLLQVPVFASNRLAILRAEIGAGKSLAAERLFQDALKLARIHENEEIPIFLEAKNIIGSLEQNLSGLGYNSVPVGSVLVVIDGLDEAPVERRVELARAARRLTFEYPSARVLVTSRPLSDLSPEFDDFFIDVPPLTREQTFALITRVAGRDVDEWTFRDLPESFIQAIARPLFAILVGVSQRGEALVPVPKGRLLSQLVEASLGRANARQESADPLLRKLARLVMDRGGAPVPISDVSTYAEAAPLLQSRLIVERKGSLVFPLAILAEWFAARELETGTPRADEMAADAVRLRNWIVPLEICVSEASEPNVSRLMRPLASQRPAFAANILAEAFSEWTHDDTDQPLPHWRQFGEQLRDAMKAWAVGMGPLAPLVAPVHRDGRLRTIGVRLSDPSTVVVSWARRTAAEEVVELPDGFHVDEEWLEFTQQYGFAVHNGWAWQWALDHLQSEVCTLLERRVLPQIEALRAEFGWRAALSVARRSGSLDPTPMPKNLLEKRLRSYPSRGTYVDSGDSFEVDRVHEVLARLMEENGERHLCLPWPGPENLIGPYVWSGYSPEALLARTHAVYTAALGAYFEAVDRWFPRFCGDLRLESKRPFKLIGMVRTATEPKVWHRGPCICYYREPNLSGPDFTVNLQLGNESAWKTFLEHVNDRLENRQIDSFRSSVLDVFDLDAAEKLTYSWLLDDLRQVHWIR